MDVAIAGGHGQIALHLGHRLSSRGDRVRGLVRDPEQADDLRAAGMEAVVADLERDDITGAVAGADAVVFAAGAGPGSGPERKHTVDKGGALKLIDAAQANGIDRYLMISAMGVKDPDRYDGTFKVYLECKRDADLALEASGLAYTIVRPGRLTDDDATGRVEVAEDLGRRGEIPRDDVAAVLVACLDDDRSVGATFEVLSGDTPIDDAVASLAG